MPSKKQPGGPLTMEHRDHVDGRDTLKNEPGESCYGDTYSYGDHNHVKGDGSGHGGHDAPTKKGY